MTEFIPPGTRWFDLPSPFAMKRGGELHGARVAYETWGTLNDARDIAEHRAIRPVIAPRDDRHQPDPEPLQILEALLVIEHVDGDEIHPVLDEEFLGFQATGAARLPVYLEWRLIFHGGHARSP